MASRVLQPRLATLARRSADELLLRTGRGDAAAFEELYYRLLPSVISFIRSKVSRAAPLEDLVQEVFCRLWEQRDRFEGRSSARSYVLGLALNVVREYRREGGNALVSPERLDLPDPGIERSRDELERREIFQFLGRARTGLTTAQAIAIGLVYDDQIPPRQAATMLGCSEAALRARLKKARQKLRTYMTGQNA